MSASKSGERRDRKNHLKLPVSLPSGPGNISQAAPEVELGERRDR